MRSRRLLVASVVAAILAGGTAVASAAAPSSAPATGSSGCDLTPIAPTAPLDSPCTNAVPSTFAKQFAPAGTDYGHLATLSTSGGRITVGEDRVDVRAEQAALSYTNVNPLLRRYSVDPAHVMIFVRGAIYSQISGKQGDPGQEYQVDWSEFAKTFSPEGSNAYTQTAAYWLFFNSAHTQLTKIKQIPTLRDPDAQNAACDGTPISADAPYDTPCTNAAWSNYPRQAPAPGTDYGHLPRWADYGNGRVLLREDRVDLRQSGPERLGYTNVNPLIRSYWLAPDVAITVYHMNYARITGSTDTGNPTAHYTVSRAALLWSFHTTTELDRALKYQTMYKLTFSADHQTITRIEEIMTPQTCD